MKRSSIGLEIEFDRDIMPLNFSPVVELEVYLTKFKVFFEGDTLPNAMSEKLPENLTLVLCSAERQITAILVTSEK